MAGRYRHSPGLHQYLVSDALTGAPVAVIEAASAGVATDRIGRLFDEVDVPPAVSIDLHTAVIRAPWFSDAWFRLRDDIASGAVFESPSETPAPPESQDLLDSLKT